MRVLRFVILWVAFLLVHQGICQPLTESQAARFIRVLVEQPDRLGSYAHPENLALADRLGIQYEGVQNKFLISYDLSPEARSRVSADRLTHRIEVLDQKGGIAQLSVRAATGHTDLTYFFQDSTLISPLRYHTRTWATRDSEHFRFLISDTSLFNGYCIENLERYFREMSSVLGYTGDDLATIASAKIYYVLCATDDEMELLTGYKARGMYNLAYDCLITTFNAHYHELVHLLMNFKLRRLPLYTHRFLQEGSAVALGGRGGKEPAPILDLGSYLHTSGLVHYTTLLSDKGFRQSDPSMSYPVSGLYNRFLLESLGIETYLELYRRFSGTRAQVDTLDMASSDLPPDSAWNAFVAHWNAHRHMQLGCGDTPSELILAMAGDTIACDSERYCFSIADTLLLLEEESQKHFRSGRYTELFGDRPYTGARYAVVADPVEISVYNLYTNNLVAKFVAPFAYPPVETTKTDGRYRFSVARWVFPVDLRTELNR